MAGIRNNLGIIPVEQGSISPVGIDLPKALNNFGEVIGIRETRFGRWIGLQGGE